MTNTKADIHQWTWYQNRKGIKYLCISAGWVKDAETGEWAPTRIELLEFLTTEPKPVPTETMIKLLESGQLVVVKSIF